MNDISLTHKGEAYALAHLRPAGCPAGVDPATWRLALERRCHDLADELQRLVDLVDSFESDPDLEDNGDAEPWLGWPVAGQRTLEGDDREVDNSDYEDDGTAEPSLASPEARLLPVDYLYSQRSIFVQSGPLCSQDRWARGSSSDCEEEHDGAEPDVSDAEPSLGRPDFQEDQSAFAGLGTDDEELVDEDGGDILDEPHDDNELDGGDWGAPDWPAPSSEMTDEQKAAVAKESKRLLRRARKHLAS